MKRFTMFVIATLLILGNMVGQVTVNVTDGTNPIEGATVSIDGLTGTTDASGDAIINGVSDATHTTTAGMACYHSNTTEIAVSSGVGSGSIILTAKTVNDVFFFIGMTGAEAGTVVNLYNGSGYNESYTVQGLPMEDVMFAGVPYGEYSYSISKECKTPVTGTTTVDCANDMGVSVFSEAPVAKTVNDVFFFIGMTGAEAGTVVNLYNGSGYNESYTVQGLPMEDVMFAGVPYGEYSYSISKECKTSVTGTTTVDCANDMGVSVFAEAPVAKTVNDVFFFIGMTGAEAGTVVNLYNGSGYNESYTVQGLPMEDVMFAGVLYGEYSYSISKECKTQVTGTTTVDCANDMGVSVFAEAPVAKTVNDVFFFIGMTGAEAGTVVNLYNGSGYNESYTVQGLPMEDVMFAGVPYGEYSYSISKECKTPVTGTTAVDCANDMGISVFAEAPAAIIIDNTVSVEGNVLTANQDGMAYQWIDVDGNNTPIDGATSQSYTVTKTGNYSVIITNGTCGSVTSEPLNVTVTAIGRLNNRPVTIYPNPASNFVNVELGAVEGRVVISLINSNGSVVDNYETTESVAKMDISNLSPGVYILNIQATGFNHTIKFIKN